MFPPGGGVSLNVTLWVAPLICQTTIVPGETVTSLGWNALLNVVMVVAGPEATVTVAVAVLVVPPAVRVAVMVAGPAAKAVTKPKPLTDAAAGLLET